MPREQTSRRRRSDRSLFASRVPGAAEPTRSARHNAWCEPRSSSSCSSAAHHDRGTTSAGISLGPRAVRLDRVSCWSASPALRVFAALRLLPMTDREKDVEILAPRHQFTALQRQLGDRARLAGGPASRVPGPRRSWRWTSSTPARQPAPRAPANRPLSDRRRLMWRGQPVVRMRDTRSSFRRRSARRPACAAGSRPRRPAGCRRRRWGRRRYRAGRSRRSGRGSRRPR
jgi:hypothetical protein